MSKRIVNWEHVYRTNYEAEAFTDTNWLRSAQDLLKSSELLEPNILKYWENDKPNGTRINILTSIPNYYQKPYFMMISFAIENLFKAAIVQENSWKFRNRFKSNGVFPRQLKGHDLVSLARKAKFKLSAGEEDLLIRLTRHAFWAGRYPVPLDYLDSSGTKTFSDGNEYLVSWYSEDDIQRLKNMTQNVFTQFKF